MQDFKKEYFQKFPLINTYKDTPVIIWWHPKWTHTHSWIHYRFYRTFKYLWYDVQWLENKLENLPDKNKQYIIITESSQDSILLNNFSKHRIIFDHNVLFEKYHKYNMKEKWIIPFNVVRYNLAKFTDKKIAQYITERDTPIMSSEEYYFQSRQISILRGAELLPHEMKREPYHYNNKKDIVFTGSWWHNNFVQLETLRLWCLLSGKKYYQHGRHLFLRPPLVKKRYLSPEELERVTKEAYISPAIQWVQVDDWYIPCRLFMNMSMSVLAVSNNPYVYNLFDDDEVIVDRDIFKMMDKAEKIIKEKRVDEYTKKAFEKVRDNHTYLNRIEELFSYL